jgi:hypothetical protein
MMLAHEKPADLHAPTVPALVPNDKPGNLIAIRPSDPLFMCQYEIAAGLAVATSSSAVIAAWPRILHQSAAASNCACRH